MVAPAQTHRTSQAAEVRTPRADSIANRERLLASSLRLFSERGYEGTSLRAITDDASANLASANYHFGSKQKLLQATFQTALEPINTERLRRLEALESAEPPVDFSDLVRAFVEPLFASNQQKFLPKLLANLFAESKEVAVPLLQSTFGPTVERFTQAFAKVLPGVDRQDLQWRLHFMVGSMLQLAHFERPLFTAEATGKRGRRPRETVNGIDHLVSFAVAGLRQDAHVTKREGK